MIQNEELPSTLYSPVIISQCTILNMTHNIIDAIRVAWYYACDTKIFILERLVPSFLLGSELPDLGWSHCVKSLLRASFLAFCHLLKKNGQKLVKKTSSHLRASFHKHHGITADMTWVNKSNFQCTLTLQLQNHN